MMHYASQGVRNATRKASNAIVHHSGHNGPGGGTTANSTTRSFHMSSVVRGCFQAAHLSPTNITTLEAIRPRSPPHKLFSSSKQIFQRFFTYLTTPGIRAPTYLSQVQHSSSRSLHNVALRGNTIRSKLSLPVRHALKSNALSRQANTFLPRGPSSSPPGLGGVAQVGLGTARNFSTGRPIFQQLAENIPIAGRALYEIDYELEMVKGQSLKRVVVCASVKGTQKSKEMLKPANKTQQNTALAQTTEIEQQENNKVDLEHYFPTTEVAPVTTYLLVPLAPTPTMRSPLPLNIRSSPMLGSSLLPPLSYLGSTHASYSTHALRVSTLFTRLDQANVWSRGGVHCSAHSQGQSHRKASNEGDDTIDEGVCTILKVEFVGWTQAEVRAVIGESGTGWCGLEEVWHEDISEDDLSEMSSLSSFGFDETNLSSDALGPAPDFLDPELIDPAQSFILPTLDISTSLHLSNSRPLSRTSSADYVFASISAQMDDNPWIEDFSDLSSEAPRLYFELSPPSTNGWFGQGDSDGFSRPHPFSSRFDAGGSMPYIF